MLILLFFFHDSLKFAIQSRREGGRAGNFYRGPRLNGGPEELDNGARNRKSMKEPYNFYRGPSILSTALSQSIEFSIQNRG